MQYREVAVMRAFYVDGTAEDVADIEFTDDKDVLAWADKQAETYDTDKTVDELRLEVRRMWTH